MKLDKDLVRKILLAIEDDDDPFGYKELSLEGHADEEVNYHVCVLAEGGLIIASDLSSLGVYQFRPQRLTYRGHEFLDTIRDGKSGSSRGAQRKKS